MSGAAHHLLGIVNNILDISKIEAGKLVLDEGDFELEQVLAGVRDLIGDRAREKGLELATEIDPRLPRRLLGDALRGLVRQRGARILVAEDNLLNQDVARELLLETGLVVDVADDGQIALDMARCIRYDLRGGRAGPRRGLAGAPVRSAGSGHGRRHEGPGP